MLALNDTINAEEALLIAGKLLFLCQKFEQLCKYIIMRLYQIDKFMKKEHSSLNQIQDYVDYLNTLFLASAIRELKKINTVSISNEDYINIFENAKNSRNYIAHELLVDLMHKESTNYSMKKLEDDFFSKNPNATNSECLAFTLEYQIKNDTLPPYILNYKFLCNKLPTHIDNIIGGLFLLEKMTYELHEKESFPFSLEKYSIIIKNWISL